MTKAPRFTQVDPRHPVQAALPALLTAALVLAAIAVGVLYFTRSGDVAEGQIAQTETYSFHSVSKANLGAPGTLGQAEVNDEMYVYCVVKLKSNLKKLPLFVQEETATLTTADGQELKNTAASPSDIPRFFQAFPAAPALPQTPLRREAKIDPGQTVEGLVLAHFPVSQDAWNERKSATLTITLYQQEPIILTIPPGK